MSRSAMVDYLLDQLNDPEVAARPMFGGHGIYRNGKMFGLVYGEAVYMKVTDEEARASDREAFAPRPNQTVPSFRAVSADQLEDRAVLSALARGAQAAAGS